MKRQPPLTPIGDYTQLVAPNTDHKLEKNVGRVYGYSFFAAALTLFASVSR